MYHATISGNLLDLADELDRPIEPGELDERGCASKELMNQIDERLRAWMTPRIAAYSPPPGLMTGSNPKSKWRVISCLQKAIRFGNVPMALNMMNVAFDVDPYYAVKRIGVIAMEDVGLGNRRAVMCALAALGSSKWRQSVAGGERQTMLWLTEQLASGFKCRAMTELLCIGLFDKRFNRFKMAELSDDELVKIALTEGDIAKQMIAAWLLAGTSRFSGEGFPESNTRTPTRLFKTMVEQGLSVGSLYMAAKAASRCSAAMFIGMLFLDKWLQQTTEPDVQLTEIPPMPKVGHMLGAAYDMHTREGKMAITKFKNEKFEQLRFWLEQCPQHRWDGQLYFGIFLAEGGLLNRRLVYKNQPGLYALTERLELEYNGLPAEHHASFLEFLQHQLPALNACRAKVLWATMKNQ